MQSDAAVISEPVDSLSNTEVAEIDTIEVNDPTGEEVLVEIVAASLCHTDIAAALGEKEEPYPYVMGHEGAGIVRSVGNDVESVQPGDHVVLGRIACGECKWCRSGQSNLCSTRKDHKLKGTLRTGNTRFSRKGTELNHFHGVSSFTEYTVVTEDVAIGITDSIPLEEATLLGCGVFTGVGAVTNTADIELGSSVAIFGAGGVGLSALQGAVMRGASEIIVVDPISEKLEIAERLGATQTINPDEVDPVARIRTITETGVDYAIEAVGHPKVMEQTVQSLAPTGMSVLVGTPPATSHNVDINLRDITVGERSIVGSFNGSYNLSLAIPRLAELIDEGQLTLSEMISDTRSLEDVTAAMRDLERGSSMRQVIIP